VANNIRKGKRVSLLGASLLGCFFTGPVYTAEVVLDGSMGTAGELLPDATGLVAIEADVGSIRGNNLFHSFDRFNIDNGETASFRGPDSINNIIARVTGNRYSLIDGTLQTTISDASLFLLNPHGVIFGPNAQLDLSGSLYVSTAEQLIFSNGDVFSSDLSAPATLSIAMPSEFGFLSSTPAPIEVAASVEPGMFIGTDKSFNLFAGDIYIGVGTSRISNQTFNSSGYVLAPRGEVKLVSVKASGQVNLNVESLDDLLDFESLGKVSVSGSSIVEAEGVTILGGGLRMRSSVIGSGIGQRFLSDESSNPAVRNHEGWINIQTRDYVDIAGSGQLFGFLEHGILAGSSTSDLYPVSPITIQTRDLTIQGLATIRSRNNGASGAGDLLLDVNTLNMASGAHIQSYADKNATSPGAYLGIQAKDITLVGNAQSVATQISSYTFASVQAGNIDIQTDNILLSSHSLLRNDSYGLDAAGDINVYAKSVVLDAQPDGNSTPGETQIRSASSGISKSSGNINIIADTLKLKNGAIISSTASGVATAGDIRIDVSKSIEVEQNNRDAPYDSGIFSSHLALENPEALDFLLQRQLGANYATIRGYFVSKGWLAPDVDVEGVLRFAMKYFFPGDAEMDLSSSGNGGNIDVKTPLLSMQGLTAIDTSTQSNGNAGSISIESDDIYLLNGSVIRSVSGGVLASDGSLQVGTGNAGSINLQVDNLQVTGNSARRESSVLTQTRGSGQGGSIDIDAQDRVKVSDGARIGSDTGGDGDAGTVAINAKHLEIQGGGIISSHSGISVGSLDLLGSGDGGLINIDTDNEVLISGDGSLISTASAGEGSGGNISLNSGSLIMDGDVSVDSSTIGNGNAGNITINSGAVSIRNGASVRSQSGKLDGESKSLVVGDGSAGEIKLSAQSLFVNGDGSNVSTQTRGIGNGGNIAIDVSGATLLSESGKISSDTGGDGHAGAIAINSNTLKLADSASISSDSGFTDTAKNGYKKDIVGSGNGGEISISTTGNLSVENNSRISTVSRGDGHGGNIQLASKTLALNASADVDASTSGNGDAGSIKIASDVVSIRNGSFVSSQSGELNSANQLLVGTGAAGLVEVVANNLAIDGGASQRETGIQVKTLGNGAGGQINLAVSGDLALVNHAQINSDTGGNSSAGDISITASNLLLNTVSKISSSSGITIAGSNGYSRDLLGAGSGGTIEINASNSVQLSDRGTTISTMTRGAGAGGNIDIQAKDINVSSQATIDSSTLGDGDGGSIVISAEKFKILQGALVSSASGQVNEQNGELIVGSGNAGTIEISGAVDIAGTRGGVASGVFTQTFGSGEGGSIHFDAGALNLSESGRIASDTNGSGDAGIIEIVAKDVSVKTGASISSDSNAETGGNGGIINIQAEDEVKVTGNGSRISTNSKGSGNGGSINITANEVEVENGGVISAVSSGTGEAGNITINAREGFENNDGEISTAAAEADGGNIRINALNRFRIRDGRINTAVANGRGKGGNIQLRIGYVDGLAGAQAVDGDPETRSGVIVVQNANISANAFGGPGGNIRIVAGQFVSSSDSVISASSQKSIDGDIDIVAPNVDVAASLTPLPTDFLDASRLLSEHCRDASKRSTLIANTASMPISDPESFISSFPGDFALSHNPIAKDTELKNEISSVTSLPAGESVCML